MSLCHGLTKKGIPCKNMGNSKADPNYCSLHQNQSNSQSVKLPLPLPLPLPLLLPQSIKPQKITIGLKSVPIASSHVQSDLSGTIRKLISIIKSQTKAKDTINRVNDLLVFLNRGNELITRFDLIKTQDGIQSAHKWIKTQVLCHPEMVTDHTIAENYAKYLVNTCSNNIEILYNEIEKLAATPLKKKQFLKDFLAKWKYESIGVCIEDKCESIIKTLSQVKVDPSYFVPIYEKSKTKMYNLGEFALLFKKNSCIDCYQSLGLPKFDMVKIDKCLNSRLDSGFLFQNYLYSNLNMKKCSDGVITLTDINQYLKDYGQYLKTCHELSDQFAIWEATIGS
jgi:hypothetical protein